MNYSDGKQRVVFVFDIGIVVEFIVLQILIGYFQFLFRVLFDDYIVDYFIVWKVYIFDLILDYLGKIIILFFGSFVVI